MIIHMHIYNTRGKSHEPQQQQLQRTANNDNSNNNNIYKYNNGIYTYMYVSSNSLPLFVSAPFFVFFRLIFLQLYFLALIACLP